MQTPARILLVDDDPDFVEITGAALRAGGYEVTAVSAVDAAMAAAAASPPDLVVTDLMMERLDSGFSFVRRLRAVEALARVPIVIVSAIGRTRGYDFAPRGPADCADMGADAFLEKPVPPALLLATVRQLLAGR